MGKKKTVNKILRNKLLQDGKRAANDNYIDFYEKNPFKAAIKKQVASISVSKLSDIDFIFDTLNQAGLDIKGQHNMALVKLQRGIALNVEVDFGSLFLPGFLELSAGANTEFKNGKALLVNLEVQRSPLLEDKYVCLSIMQGVCRDWTVEVEAKAGVKIPELPKIKDIKSIKRIEHKLEAVAFSLNVEAQAHAGGSYKGQFIYVFEPILPRWYPRNDEKLFVADLKSTLHMYVFGEKLDKPLIKQEACEFLNSLNIKNMKVRYKKRSIGRLIGKGHISTQKLVNKLENIKDRADIPDVKKEDAERLIELLKRWGGKTNKPVVKTNKYCSLRLWGHKGAADAGANFKIAISREGKSQQKKSKGEGSIEAGVSAAASINGSFKMTSFRYQTLHVDDIVKTQDTIITYKQAGAQLSAELAVGGEGKGSQGIGSKVNVFKNKEKSISKGKEKKWVFVNQMSYKAAILYWRLIDPSKKALIDSLVKRGAVKVLPTDFNFSKIQVLDGSGLIFGQSITLGGLLTLKNYVQSSFADIQKDKGKYSYIYLLMQSLGMDFTDDNYQVLKRFVDHLDTFETIDGLIENFMVEFAKMDGLNYSSLKDDDIYNKYRKKAKCVGVLIEASYTTKTSVVSIKKNKNFIDKLKKSIKHKSKTEEPSLMEPNDLINELEKGKLQSLRLRYRKREISSTEKNIFKLGISVGIVKTGIALKEAEEVGREGIVDISVYYIDGKLDPDSAEAVPPAVLFYQ